ncbi:hypothetical protein NUSPORA_01456 [Nucleospora cyclopteri]
MSSDDEEINYMPDLFSRAQSVTNTTHNKQIIPQNTYYDASVCVQHVLETRHVTVFGYSQQNRLEVLNKIKNIAKVQRIEEGKNFLSIWCEDVQELEKIVKLNHQKIQGELIGVFRQNFGVIDKPDIYAKKTSLLQKISNYLFGE